MSCRSCAVTFGFLKTEHGCPSCGFAFCSKCLKYELKDSKSKLSVCRICSETSHSTLKKMEFQPPDVFLKRLETMEDPTRPPVTVYTHDPSDVLKRLHVEKPKELPSEIEMRGRLQKLRKRLTAAPSVEEMEERLAKLQGMPMKKKSYSVDMAALPESAEQQTQNLMKQMEGEAGLEKGSQEWQHGVESRLAKLKGISSTSTEHDAEPVKMEQEPSDAEGLMHHLASKLGPTPEEVPDEESELELVNKILKQVALAEKIGAEDSEECSQEFVVDENMQEELPWCSICNEDASLRCPSCDGDLFCAGCFKEGHDVCDMRDHKPLQYQAKEPTNL